MKKRIEILWLGVTPLEGFAPLQQCSNRVKSLTLKYKSIRVSFPDNTDGMETYEEWQNHLDEFDVIATDEEKINESWEGFFQSKNCGKQIIQYKDGEWTEIKSGFSKIHGRS